MRRFLLFFALTLVLVTVFISAFERKELEPYVEILGRLIRQSRLQTVCDEGFGFKFRCPECFHPDQYDTIPHHFRYLLYPPSIYKDAEGEVELECYASINHQGLSIRQLADSITEQIHPTAIRMLPEGFVLSGPLYQEGSRIPGRHFYARYVLRQKAVFVYSMTYPEGYAPALERMRKLIDEWEVWEEADAETIKKLKSLDK